MSNTEPKTYSIRQMADEFGVTLRFIRFYENEGLIAPLRVGVTRIFREEDRARLKIISAGRELNISAAGIAATLAQAPELQWNYLLNKAKAQQEEAQEELAAIDLLIEKLTREHSTAGAA